MPIRFVGDLSLVWTIVIAVVMVVVVWTWYRNETRRGTTGFLRWFLPLLRCAAFAMVLFVLAGPVLRHRQTVGQLGRVLVFVDNSKSMSLGDQQMPASQKLLIAQQNGWLPEETIDDSLWLEVENVRSIRFELIGAVEAAEESQTTHSGDGDSSDLGNALAQAQHQLAAVEARLKKYGDRTKFLVANEATEQDWPQFLEHVHQMHVGLTKASGGGDVLPLKVRELCHEIALTESTLRSWFEASCQERIASGSSSINSALANFDGHSRWSRMEVSLLDPDFGLLSKLSTEHHLELLSLADHEAVRMWDTYGSEPIPTKFQSIPDNTSTDLSTAIQGELGGKVDARGGQAKNGKTAVLIVTDGQHNRGSAPIEMAGQLGNQEVPVFTMGVGALVEPRDLAILEIEHPKVAHRSDSVRGVVTIKDQMGQGTPFVIQVAHEKKVVWQKELISLDVAERRVPFEFPLEGIVADSIENLAIEAKFNSLAVKLEASIVPLSGEVQVGNNTAPFRIKATVHDRRVLLIDGRSRWEFRYLRNLFERDENWTTETLVVGPGTDNPKLLHGEEPGMFPAESAGLRKYDLIIFGELAPGILEPQDEIAIREFVEQHAGGIIFIDGGRGHLRQINEQVLKPLLPIEWLPEQKLEVPSSLVVTAEGQRLASLMLTNDADDNDLLWSYLPVPHTPIAVEALPGSETLVEFTLPQKGEQENGLPMLVTRKFGAGRVLYCASDESWRWRFKNGDDYHQRFWNQIASWVMETPFSVSDDYVSLDADSIIYEPGGQARLRVRLRDDAGKSVRDVSADALLWKNGQVVATIPLAEDENQSGVFRGKTPPLDHGEYAVSVQAAGFQSSAMKARVQFSVLDETEDELKLLGCNADLLNSVSRISGGEYVGEEQYQELADLLRPLSTGRVIETETVLWQSYWWFGAIICVLGLEWFLRKRSGLL
jgi:uncharacterized membrane protein